MTSADGWEAWEKGCTAMGEVVKSLKTGGGAKEDVDAAVAELLNRKKMLTEALNAAIAAAPDDATKEMLTAKLPPAPKPSKSDKKKEKKEGGGAVDAAAAEKEANIKKNEELKAAARAKKKEDAKKGGGGGGDAKPEKPAAAEKKEAAPAAAAAKPAAPTPAAAPTVAGVKNTKGQNKTLELHYSKDGVPIMSILASKLAKKEVVYKKVDGASKPLLLLPLGNGTLCGDLTIARYFARLDGSMYGALNDALSASEVDQFLESCDELLKATGQALTALVQALDKRLAMRAVLCGHSVSLADMAAWLAIKKNPAADKAVSGGGPHVKRWMKYLDSLKDFNSVAQEHLGLASKSAGSMDLDLVGAEMGKVITRFPPEPSGHLHIGHVKACMLNSYFASRYEGKMLLRFDDTNPSKEKEEYEDAIRNDLGRLGITPFKKSHTSDYFAEIKEYAIKMIKDGLAYVDPSPQEEQQKGRFEKKESKYRNTPVAENLRLFDEMHKGSEEGLKCCLRAKIDMQANNGSLRDPTIYRTNLVPHAQTKDKYKAYPTYDLACPIVDSLEGVTHALRDLQYSDRDAQYNWFLENLKLRKVEIWGFARINFKRTLLSKRKLQWLVDEKKADGWDDPRFPTVAGILRRGMTVAALKKFILDMGAARNTNLMEWDKLWTENKYVIDPIASRYTALLSDGIVPLILSNGPKAPYAESLPKHPKDETLGKKVRLFASTVLLQADDAASIAKDEEVTLMSWGNAIVREIIKDGSGKVVSLKGELHLEGSVKSTKKKLTWLADTPDATKVELIDLDFIISKDKVEEEDKLEDIFTEKSYIPYNAVGEASLRTLKKGETIQVERRGFYICDEAYLRPEEPIKLIFVPDGKNMMGVKNPEATSLYTVRSAA